MANTFPSASGIYFFKSKDNIIIYVGKANCIKTRIASYFQKNKADWKINALLDEHITIEYLLTESETEALLLEARLIKEHQPKYNVLLKSGQPFLYILFTKQELPVMKLVRNKKEKGTYFGPFLHKSSARKVLTFLQQTFQLILCNKSIENGCLNYHLGTCAGSCKKDFNKLEYIFRIQLAIDALKKDHASFIKKIKEKISDHNRQFEFEKAQHLNEYLLNIDRIFEIIKIRFNETKFAADMLAITMPLNFTQHAGQINRELQSFLKTEKPITSVDCFDISHFQSQFIVGSCVRFTNGKPDKNKFRRFKIKSITTQNDYAALQEIVRRRYKDAQDLPDVILIDGGKGQLNAVKHLIDGPLFISLAKREETIYGTMYPDGIKLDIQTSVGQFFIGLRDYAHHFAISYHKKRRSTPLKGK